MQITITVSPTELLEVLSGINADISITAPKKQPTAVEISRLATLWVSRCNMWLAYMETVMKKS